MYSVINVDISEKNFLYTHITYRINGRSTNVETLYSQKAIIRGSSTVNGDSAHDSDPLAKEHNYVSFYVKSIKIRYDVSFGNGDIRRDPVFSCYVILFKLPYKDDEDVRSKLITSNGNINSMVLYSHPECVLAYDIINLNYPAVKSSSTPRFLNCNKPFVVGPNDYVGIFYYFPVDDDRSVECKVESTAKVIFKPQ